MKLDAFEKAVAEFMWAVEELFNRDFEYTKLMFPDVAEGGTFLEPELDNEAEDWGNRAFFLERYRKLRAEMRRLGVKPIGPFDEQDEPP